MTQLKSVATISAGHPFREKIEEVAGSNVVVVQMKNVTDGGHVEWSQCKRTTVITKRKPQWLKTNDILIAARGNHFYSALIDEKLPSGLKALASPHFYLISLIGDAILPEFLVWQLNQEPCQRYFVRNTEGSVTKSIRRTVLEDTPIVMPPISKQQAILRLHKILRKERQIIERLKLRGEQINTLLANELLTQSQQTEHQSPQKTI